MRVGVGVWVCACLPEDEPPCQHDIKLVELSPQSIHDLTQTHESTEHHCTNSGRGEGGGKVEGRGREGGGKGEGRGRKCNIKQATQDVCTNHSSAL